MKNHSDIEAADLQQLLKQPKVLLVDVRNDDEVTRGGASGATPPHTKEDWDGKLCFFQLPNRKSQTQ
jgi:predicted sulfurtransferase